MLFSLRCQPVMHRDGRIVLLGHRPVVIRRKFKLDIRRPRFLVIPFIFALCLIDARDKQRL